MTIEPERDQFFQYATYGIVGLTLVICLCYGLIFLNPRANPIGALRPAAEIAAATSTFALPATWTPTLTLTPTDTPTPEPTGTVTNTPTNAPTDTNTPPATLTPVSTRAPAVRPTSRPVVRTSTPVPPTSTPVPPTSTPEAPSSFKFIKFQQSANCSGWNLHGTVWDRGYGQGLLPGTRVRVWVDGRIYATDVAGSHNKNNAAYWEVRFSKNQAEDGSIAIVGPNGKILSPRRTFHLTQSCTGKNAVTQIVIDFARDD